MIHVLNNHIFDSKFFVSKKRSNDKSVFEVTMSIHINFYQKNTKLKTLMKLFGKEKGIDFFTSLFEYFDFKSNKSF